MHENERLRMMSGSILVGQVEKMLRQPATTPNSLEYDPGWSQAAQA